MTEASRPVQYLVRGMSSWADLTRAGEQGDGNVGERLSAHLLTSLQMQNLLVLTGSGTSLEVGGPTMQQLWELCVGSPRHDQAAAVFKTLKYDPAQANIEDLLSRCDAQLQATGHTPHVQEFRKACIKKILDRCREIGLQGQHDLKPHLEFIRRLARRRARDPRLRLFTTNYDLCFERAAAGLGLTAIDGFSFTTPRRFDPRYFSYDIVSRAAHAADGHGFVPGVFQYLKLHGSVDWELNSRGSVTINEAAPAERACLIYPTRQKFQLSYQQPHLELMAQFLSALREANTCLLVVGFGFNDSHLTEPILSALETNPHLRVLIVSPRANHHYGGEDPTWKRWRRFFERGDDVGFVRATFSEFVPLVPDLRVLTPGERLERDIRQLVDGV